MALSEITMISTPDGKDITVADVERCWEADLSAFNAMDLMKSLNAGRFLQIDCQPLVKALAALLKAADTPEKMKATFNLVKLDENGNDVWRMPTVEETEEWVKQNPWAYEL